MISAKPNLLFVVHRFPYPPNRGDRIRSFHLLKFLVKHYNVYLGTLHDEQPTPHEIEVLTRMCAQFASFPVGRYSRWMRAAGSVVCGGSATEGLFNSPALKNCIRDWTRKVDFEFGLVFCSSMVQYLDAAQDLPMIVDLVDVDSQKWFDYADRTPGWKRMLFRLEGRRLRCFERTLPARCRAITLVSEAEAELFRGHCPNDHTFGVSNGVDLDYFNPKYLPSDIDPVRESDQLQLSGCVFVGALDYRANVQALEWFCQNCWPSIRKRKPDSTLEMVGRNPVAAVRRLAELPGVKLIGQVPDVRPYLHRSAVAVAPLLTARGIQNKVLEAMAMGKAVIATPQAVEGIGCRAGEHLLRVSTPAEWVETTVELLNDTPRQRLLGESARAFVQHNYSWAAMLERLEPLLGLRTTEQTTGGEEIPSALKCQTVNSG